jgi:ABC-type Zn uptake system ZnuABC Zn-binding protein ZnuA
MKIKIAIILILISILLLTGCKNNTLKSEKVGVVTTLYPLYEFTKAVGKEKVDVKLLLPPGAEAHTFEPKPSDIIRINNADMFVYIGAGMEPWAHDIIEGADNKNLLLLDASSKATLLKSDAHGEHSQKHAFEWAGIFELKAGDYTWSFAKVDKEYADLTMKMVILESGDIESIEEKAERLIQSETQEWRNNNEILLPLELNYLLNFDMSEEKTVFIVRISKDGKYAFFTEHLPTEFEAEEHFFKDANGVDVAPIVKEPEKEYHHREYDPHLWLDFSNDMKIVDAIAEELSKKDPANKEYYLANAKSYKQELAELDDNYEQGLNSCKQKEFITGGHNAYAYLAKSYGISYLSAFGISPDSEPTPKAIKKIADLTKEHGIKYVLFEELVSPRMAEAIAEQAGAKTMVLNPGHNLMKEEFESGTTFISLMEENLKTLRIVLECE